MGRGYYEMPLGGQRVFGPARPRTTPSPSTSPTSAHSQFPLPCPDASPTPSTPRRRQPLVVFFAPDQAAEQSHSGLTNMASVEYATSTNEIADALAKNPDFVVTRNLEALSGLPYEASETLERLNSNGQVIVDATQVLKMIKK